MTAPTMTEGFPAYPDVAALPESSGRWPITRGGSTLSPLLIGIAASNYSIGVGMGLLGISYAVCAFIPGVSFASPFQPQHLKTSALPEVVVEGKGSRDVAGLELRNRPSEPPHEECVDLCGPDSRAACPRGASRR